ncbi:DUF7504 family protein [Haloplanus pelagicus]|uniref:DUF7504 family protein n=1 Tax=Haloplanus pelagicus TaxID=2949995 RepID=UPI0020416D2D|nr:hypothetical protein [Haloplanus sp. HW8-1]
MASTLHLTDTPTTVEARTCESVTPPACTEQDTPGIIVVALAGSPVRWLDGWESAIDTDTDRATFVVDEAASWLAGDAKDRLDAEAPPATDVCVRTVASPGNLTDLGVTLTEALETQSADPTLLCFQSLTVLLQYSPSDEVYRFLHTLVTHVDRADVTAHFHLHEGAHEAETVATLRPLFDRVRSDGQA